MKQSQLPGVISLISASAILAAYPAISQTVGVNAAVRNAVNIQANGASISHKTVVKERVTLGEYIAAERDSALQAILLDKTTLTVGPNAKLRVDKFVYDPNRNSSSVALSVAKGAFRFVSGKALQNQPGQSSIRTPVASIGIRGTMVEGFIGPDAAAIAAQEGWNLNGAHFDARKASLIVLRGPGLKAGNGVHPGGIDVTAGGKTISLDGSGLAVIVPKLGAAPLGPFPLSNTGYAAFDKALRNQPSAAAAPNPGSQASGHVSNLAIGAGLAAVVAGIAVASSSGNPKSP